MAGNLKLVSFTPDGASALAFQHASGYFKSYSTMNEIVGRVSGVSHSTGKRTLRFPLTAQKSYDGRVIEVFHQLVGALAASRSALEGTLYSPWLRQAGDLTYTENGVTKVARAMPLELRRDEDARDTDDIGRYRGTWLLLSGISYSASADAYSDTVPGTVSVTNDGNIASDRVTYTITPTAQKAAADGQRYGERITIANRSPRELVDHPILVTPGGWDHAAEVTATRSAADGDDVEVYVNGRRYPRWTIPGGTRDWNQSTTMVWSNLTMPPARYWTLRTGVNASATEFELDEPAYDLPAFPFYVVNASANEVVLVTAYDEDSRTLTVKRGRRDTSGQTWSAGAVMYWATGIVDLVYGWTSAPTPTYIDDRYKPIFLESNVASTNTSWTLNYYFETPVTGDTQSRYPRPGSWFSQDLAQRERERTLGDGDMFTHYIPPTPGANPATSLGLVYRSAGAAEGRPVMDRWTFRSPISIASMTIDYDATGLGVTGPAAGKFFEAFFEIWYVDADGNEVRNLQDEQNSAAGYSVNPTSAYEISLRVVPYDTQSYFAETYSGAVAIEPTDGDGWSADTIVMNFDSAETPLVAWPGTMRNLYQVGRPDDPATITSTTGEVVAIAGTVIFHDRSNWEALQIDVDAHATSMEGTAGDGIGWGHRVTGDLPKVPAGTADVTYAETGGASVTLGVSVYDAWD